MKYGSQKMTIHNITFDSKAEANFYLYVLSLKQSGEIKEFQLQPKFTLLEAFKDKWGKKHQPITYIADFLVTYPDGEQVVFDVKGMETTDFKIKKKLFIHKYPNLRLKLVAWDSFLGWVETSEIRKRKRKGRKKG